MRRLFKFLLATNSLMVMAVIYFMKEPVWIGNHKTLSVGVYIITPIVLAGCCLLLSDGLPKESANGGFSNGGLVDFIADGIEIEEGCYPSGSAIVDKAKEYLNSVEMS